MRKLYIIILLAISISLTGCNSTFQVQTDKLDAESLLWHGINRGNLELVKEAVADGADVNKFSNFMRFSRNDHTRKVRTPLYVAVALGKLEIADYLIDCNADVNCVDSQGESLLQYCAEYHPRLIEKVILGGADISYADNKGNTALEYAADYDVMNGKETSFEILIKYGAEPTQKTLEKILSNMNDYKYGMLRTVLESVDNISIDSSIKKAVLGLDNDIQIDDSNKDIVLGSIAAFGEWDILKQYIDKETNAFCSKLLKIAIMYNNKTVVENLISEQRYLPLQDREDYLYYSAFNDDIELIDMVYNGVGGNAPLAMSQAILKHNNSVVKHFIDMGVDPNSKVMEGTLLTSCCFYNNYEAAVLLLDKGAEPDDTALSKACSDGDTEFVELFLKSGANADCKNFYPDGSGGNSALMRAISNGNFECVKLLVEYGADISYEYCGQNALAAAKAAHSENIYNYISNIAQ